MAAVSPRRLSRVVLILTLVVGVVLSANSGEDPLSPYSEEQIAHLEQVRSKALQRLEMSPQEATLRDQVDAELSRVQQAHQDTVNQLQTEQKQLNATERELARVDAVRKDTLKRLAAEQEKAAKLRHTLYLKRHAESLLANMTKSRDLAVGRLEQEQAQVAQTERDTKRVTERLHRAYSNHDHTRTVVEDTQEKLSETVAATHRIKKNLVDVKAELHHTDLEYNDEVDAVEKMKKEKAIVLERLANARTDWAETVAKLEKEKHTLTTVSRDKAAVETKLIRTNTALDSVAAKLADQTKLANETMRDKRVVEARLDQANRERDDGVQKLEAQRDLLHQNNVAKEHMAEVLERLRTLQEEISPRLDQERILAKKLQDGNLLAKHKLHAVKNENAAATAKLQDRTVELGVQERQRDRLQAGVLEAEGEKSAVLARLEEERGLVKEAEAMLGSFPGPQSCRLDASVSKDMPGKNPLSGQDMAKIWTLEGAQRGQPPLDLDSQGLMMLRRPDEKVDGHAAAGAVYLIGRTNGNLSSTPLRITAPTAPLPGWEDPPEAHSQEFGAAVGVETLTPVGEWVETQDVALEWPSDATSKSSDKTGSASMTRDSSGAISTVDKCQAQCVAVWGRGGCRAIEFNPGDGTCITFTDGECCSGFCKRLAGCPACAPAASGHGSPCSKEDIENRCGEEAGCLKTPFPYSQARVGWSTYTYSNPNHLATHRLFVGAPGAAYVGTGAPLPEAGRVTTRRAAENQSEVKTVEMTMAPQRTAQTGRPLAISPDGKWLAVASHRYSPEGVAHAGMVDLFELDQQTTTFYRRVTSPSLTAVEMFGYSLVWMGNCSLAIASMGAASHTGLNREGRVYLFWDLVGPGAPVETAPPIMLVSPRPRNGQYFGRPGTMEFLEDTFLVIADLEAPSTHSGQAKGAIYIATRRLGNKMVEITSKTPSEGTLGLQSVLAGHGTVVVKDPMAHAVLAQPTPISGEAVGISNGPAKSGALYIWTEDMGETAVAIASQMARGGLHFGGLECYREQVYLCTDERTVWIRAGVVVVQSVESVNHLDRAGALYVLTTKGPQAGSRLIRITPPVARYLGEFGMSNFFGAGEKAVVADKFIAASDEKAEVDGQPAAGAVYIFDLPHGKRSFRLVNPRKRSAGASQFGRQLALSDRHLVVSAPLETELEPGDGAVYLWPIVGGTVDASRGTRIASPTPCRGCNFGERIALHGGLLAVGTPAQGIAGAVHAGAAYLLNLTDSRAIAKYEPYPPLPGGLFGTLLHLDGEGLRIEHTLDRVKKATNAGSVYLATEASGWGAKKIVSHQPTANAHFGRGVRARMEHGQLVLREYHEPVGAVADAGAVYVWSPGTRKLRAPTFARTVYSLGNWAETKDSLLWLPVGTDPETRTVEIGTVRECQWKCFSDWGIGCKAIQFNAKLQQCLTSKGPIRAAVGSWCSHDSECYTNACDTGNLYKCRNVCVVDHRDRTKPRSFNCPGAPDEAELKGPAAAGYEECCSDTCKRDAVCADPDCAPSDRDGATLRHNPCTDAEIDAHCGDPGPDCLELPASRGAGLDSGWSTWKFTSMDDDDDGVPNQSDTCPGTSPGRLVDFNGCEYGFEFKLAGRESDNDAEDADGDGIVDPLDQCPGTASDQAVDQTGCAYQNLLVGHSSSPSDPGGPMANIVSDGDGFWDCNGQGFESSEFETRETFVILDTGCPKGVDVASITLTSASNPPTQFELSAGDTPDATSLVQAFSGDAFDGAKEFRLSAAGRGRYWKLRIRQTSNGQCSRLQRVQLSACPGNVCTCLWDSDNDGILDPDDMCQKTPWGETTDFTGCDPEELPVRMSSATPTPKGLFGHALYSTHLHHGGPEISQFGVLVRASQERVDGAAHAGSIYFLENTPGSTPFRWSSDSDDKANEGFGDAFSFEISRQGFMFAGEFRAGSHLPRLLETAGKVVVYSLSVDNELEVLQELVAPSRDLLPSSRFGAAVALANGRLWVGAPYQQQGPYQMVGAVFVFESSENKFDTDPDKVITIANPETNHHQFFGTTLVASASHMFVASPGAMVNSRPAGAVWSYRLADLSEPPLKLSGTTGYCWFCMFGVSMELHGNMLLIRDPHWKASTNGHYHWGAVWVVSASDPGAANRSLHAPTGLTASVVRECRASWSGHERGQPNGASSPSEAACTPFGSTLAVADNKDVLIGDPYALVRPAGEMAGVVYRFNDPLGESSVERLSAPDPRAWAQFGSSLSVADGELVVGMPRTDLDMEGNLEVRADENTTTKAGLAFVYQLNQSQHEVPALSRQRPLVLKSANPTISGHFGKVVAVGGKLIGVISDKNPLEIFNLNGDRVGSFAEDCSAGATGVTLVQAGLIVTRSDQVALFSPTVAAFNMQAVVRSLVELGALYDPALHSDFLNCSSVMSQPEVLDAFRKWPFQPGKVDVEDIKLTCESTGLSSSQVSDFGIRLECSRRPSPDAKSQGGSMVTNVLCATGLGGGLDATDGICCLQDGVATPHLQPASLISSPANPQHAPSSAPTQPLTANALAAKWARWRPDGGITCDKPAARHWCNSNPANVVSLGKVSTVGACHDLCNGFSPPDEWTIACCQWDQADESCSLMPDAEDTAWEDDTNHFSAACTTASVLTMSCGEPVSGHWCNSGTTFYLGAALNASACHAMCEEYSVAATRGAWTEACCQWSSKPNDWGDGPCELMPNSKDTAWGDDDFFFSAPCTFTPP